jgi:hypothetical protein
MQVQQPLPLGRLLYFAPCINPAPLLCGVSSINTDIVIDPASRPVGASAQTARPRGRRALSCRGMTECVTGRRPSLDARPRNVRAAAAPSGDWDGHSQCLCPLVPMGARPSGEWRYSARHRILGHERPGWCYPTGRCAYLPSVTCYRQSIKPPPPPPAAPPRRQPRPDHTAARAKGEGSF